MGTKVQIENYLAGHCSMRDLNHESNGASWPSCFGDDNLPNGQVYYGFLPRTVADSHSWYDKDVVKQTMLEHEAIFKDQVYELHRLYRVQRDLMDEVRRKEQFERQIAYETSSSSSPVPSQLKSENVQRWNGPSLPLANSVCGRPTSGLETVQSSPHSIKGKSIQGSLSPFQNCYSPKNSEVSDSRPTKLRRRILDLQLPADEYLDTDEVEHFGDAKVSDNISSSPEKNGKVTPENWKLLLHYAGKTEVRGDVSRSDSHAGRSKALADLNEPLHVEETAVISSADFLNHASSHSDVKYWNIPTNHSSSLKDVTQSSMHGSLNGISKNYCLENRPSSQDMFCYALESEQQKGSLRYNNQGIHLEKKAARFLPVKVVLDQAGQPPAFLKGDSWKAKSGVNLEKSDKSYSMSNYNVTEQMIASRLPSQPSFLHPPDLGKSSDQCGSPWGKSSSGVNQKSMSVQTVPFLAPAILSKSPHSSSAQSNCLFDNKLNLNCSPGANGSFNGERYKKNGFYQESAATSFRELPAHIPPVGFDSSGKNVLKATALIDVKRVKDVNLNVALPNDESHDYEPQDPLAVLPWLGGKSTCSNKPEKSNGSPIFECPSSRKILGVPIYETSPTAKRENSGLISHLTIENRSTKEETGTSGRKLVFDMNLPCELSDSELDNMGVEKEEENAGIVEKKMNNESAILRNHFDLNSCITDEEIPCVSTTPLPDKGTNRKGDTGIDLEAPIVLEDEETILSIEDSLTKEPEKLLELPPSRAASDEGYAELVRSAAEAIIAISSLTNVVQSEEEVICVPEEADVEDHPLHWLADIACSSGKDNSGDCLPKELDDFESMTLRLKECTFEEYFPKPSIPEFPNIDEGNKRVLTTRTRKGQGRRGRQRRDFQRDILPGLTSLSRHEVTEDMQTFGGLMRATGYSSWQCGPNRRNGRRRGRPRAVIAAAAAAVPAPVHTGLEPIIIKQQELEMNSSNNKREVGLEDRSLTGWGKTTRRPRRQRLPPAGNLTPPPPLPLS